MKKKKLKFKEEVNRRREKWVESGCNRRRDRLDRMNRCRVVEARSDAHRW